MRQVLTEAAENAVNRINRVLALHAIAAAANSSSWAGRLRGTSGLVKTDPARYLILPHIVAIAEEFSRTLLIAKTEVQVPQDARVLKKLWAKAENQAEGRWEEHLNAWKDWHEVSLQSDPLYTNLKPFIEARNAIMHGLGELTRRQRRGNQLAALKGELRAAGIEVVGVRLIVSNRSVIRCAHACRAFVDGLDRRAQSVK
jgi:hypothetical protein